MCGEPRGVHVGKLSCAGCNAHISNNVQKNAELKRKARAACSG